MKKTMEKAVIIVAGGTGKRMGSETPKQFLEIAGKPVVMHTVEVFYRYDKTIRLVVVLPARHIETWKRLCTKHRFSVPHETVPGGRERFFSVKKGLERIDPECLVAVHDGVRPLVSIRVIDSGFEAAEIHGSAIPVIVPAESVRWKDGDDSKPVERDRIVLVQTPQVFDSALLKKAYEIPFRPSFTDDASVFEAAGHSVHLIDGNAENIKITRPADLKFAESIVGTLPEMP